MKKQKKENWLKRAYRHTMYALKSFLRPLKRMLIGGMDGLNFEEERLESPSRLVRASFFRNKAAVFATVILFSIFAFVFIAPSCLPMNENYTDPLQQNISPSYRLRALPRALKKEISWIDGFSDFTIGVSKKGELYVWGNTENRLQKKNVKDIPDVVKKEGVLQAAAGKDHIIAVTKTGKIVGFGDDSCGQYGGGEILNAIPMPSILLSAVAPESVSFLSCGYQASALTMQDGRAYVWGNKNTVRNLSDFVGMLGVEKIVFTNSAAVALLKNGQVSTGKEQLFFSAVSSINGQQKDFNAYMVGRKVLDIAANHKCIALLVEGDELVVAGAFENDENKLPRLKEGEYFLSIDGGTRHFVGVTNLGGVYAWGHNAYKQCEVKNTKGVQRAFAGALQTYLVDGQGKLLKSAGLKGYLMGTDGRGRDVFTRIAHGGKMTMTIGGVAVLVSTLIAIIVGCISGYFGGWVDTLLMRITEIFSSMPFLPFAMLLSQIIKNYNISETMRIFIIMLILGALSWTGLARMIRGQVLSEREKEFVTAARAMGVKEGKIAFRHVLPNVASVILVSVTLNFAACLLTESSLSYLGFGVQQPQPTWGNMLSGSNSSIVIQNYWWQWFFPALFLSIATICINVIGDGLRDAFDPKNE